MSQITTIVEYIWIGGNNELRSKTKVITNHDPLSLNDIPEWNYDGSSTEQASGSDSEVIIRPCAMFNDPFRGNPHKIVMCDTYTPHGKPLFNNHRIWANTLFDSKLEEEPWFGLEQEYFLISPDTNKPLGFDENKKQGQFYCSVGAENAYGRVVADEHLLHCVKAGIKISGINAEVAPGQWEFQIGPCTGIEQGDHLWMARYLLQRVAEKYKLSVDFNPKPLTGDWNGSGLHTNFSIDSMRRNANMGIYHDIIDKLEKKHNEHIAVYGKDNDQRLTGLHETQSINKFTYGESDRGASIRIPVEVIESDYTTGYLEDRRPAANANPYEITKAIIDTIT